MTPEQIAAVKVAYLEDENAQLRAALLDARIRLGDVTIADEKGADNGRS